MDRVLCFDIGGTMLKYGLGNLQGEILEEHTVPNTILKEKAEGMLKQILGIYNSYIERGEKIIGMALATAGIVEEGSGLVLEVSAENFPGYKNFPLGERLRKATGLPVTVGNDLNMAALGEYYLGAGQGANLLVMLAMGTGVGSAIIYRGQLIVGKHGATGEVGYHFVSSGLKVDDAASTRGLVNYYAKLSGEPLEKINGKLIVERVLAGEELATRALSFMSDNLAEVLVTLAKVVDPDCFVLGGGVMESSSVVLPFIRKALAKQNTIDVFKNLDLRPASLGNKAGMYGALHYFMRKEK